MPGDHVVCCDDQGRVSVNDQALNETAYLPVETDGSTAKPSTIRFDVVVPADRVFVMGDNREHSRDSRCHLNDVQAGAQKGDNAFVPEDLVVGRAIAVVWPLGNAGRLPTPATFENLPAGKIPAPDHCGDRCRIRGELLSQTKVKAATSGPPPKTLGGQAASFVKELLLVVIGAIVVSSLLRAFVGSDVHHPVLSRWRTRC